MGEVNNIAPQMLSTLIELQQSSLENGHSFVFCNFSTQVKTYLKDQDLLDEIQYTPTENEAIEIVHMDEIEREMWDGA
jgi:anti-anti-sigma regulatory factor